MEIVGSEYGTHPREVLASPEDIDVAFSNITFRTVPQEEKVKREENEHIKNFPMLSLLCVLQIVNWTKNRIIPMMLLVET